MKRRWLPWLFVLGSAVLLFAVFFGNRMGDRVVGQFADRIDLQPTEIPSVAPVASDPKDERRVFWKKAQVVTAATDPAFPDPRVTPAPTPSPKPATPKPTSTPEPTPAPDLPSPTELLTPVPAPTNTPAGPTVTPAPQES